MVIFKKISDLAQYLASQKSTGKHMGFVPTMGALHDGHASLIANSRADRMLTVCSIFVNPTQFNDKKDLEKYPVSTESDIELLIRNGCDILFLPDVTEIYPKGPDAVKSYDFGYLETVLEGARRPGHFKGVGQVVGRLLEIVQPEKLYMGQKDYQQCMVVKKLISVIDIKSPELVICATRREQDGLAMSSRNRRLTEPQRALAGIIYQCLVSIQSKKETGNFATVQKECTQLMIAKGFDVEYVSLADASDLTLLDHYSPDSPMVALIAARIGEIRLIDNLLL